MKGSLALTKPVIKQSRTAPASGALPRPQPTAPSVSDIIPPGRGRKRKNAITIDVPPEMHPAFPIRPRDPRRRDPRLEKRDRTNREETRRVQIENKEVTRPARVPELLIKVQDGKNIWDLPPIPKLSQTGDSNKEMPRKRKVEHEKKDVRVEKAPRRELSSSGRDSSDSSSPEKRSENKDVPETEPSNVMEEAEKIIPLVQVKPATASHKKPSTELLSAEDGKANNTERAKFDNLFGNEDVNLRQLPQAEEASAPPPPTIRDSSTPEEKMDDEQDATSSRMDWHEVKEKCDDVKKAPSKLDLVRAKLAEATEVKDGLVLDAEDHKEKISTVKSQTKEQYSDGHRDYHFNALMHQIKQLNEKLDLKTTNNKTASLSSSLSERNNFSVEGVTPAMSLYTPPDSRQGYLKVSDVIKSRRMDYDGNRQGNWKGRVPMPPRMPPFRPFNAERYPVWRGNRQRMEEFAPRPFRGPNLPYFRGNRPRPPFEPLRPLLPPLPYERSAIPPLQPRPPSTAPASACEYRSAEPCFAKSDRMPRLETGDDKPNPMNPLPSNLNVHDLFAKLVATGLVQVNQNKGDAKVEINPEKPKPKEDRSVVHEVDLLRPETLKVKQPALVAKLYGGMQCSNCSVRFPPEHTSRYSQHLDWHFRENTRRRNGARRSHSRQWYYSLSDWAQSEEVEYLEEREKSWFETNSSASKPQPESTEQAPSVAAGALGDDACALCGDKFDQFYHEDEEEWHLRNCVRHDELNYHPTCCEDYKASKAKKEAETKVIEEVAIDKIDPDEIRDTDDINSQSDNESVVEVVEPPEAIPEVVEIEEGDEDDVIYKAEPVEQVVVEDDADTDDETALSRAERDKLIKIKQEPIDPDDEPIFIAEEEGPASIADTARSTLAASIDGNVTLEAAPVPAVPPAGGIRINILKAPTFVNNVPEPMLEDVSADDEPLPPGEEPQLEYKLKPSLEGIRFSRQPPTQRGVEMSGLCSIM